VPVCQVQALSFAGAGGCTLRIARVLEHPALHRVHLRQRWSLLYTPLDRRQRIPCNHDQRRTH
jgi:hypothetical protein